MHPYFVVLLFLLGSGAARADSDEILVSPYGPDWYEAKRLDSAAKLFARSCSSESCREIRGTFVQLEPLYRRMRIFFGVEAAFFAVEGELKGLDTPTVMTINLSKIPLSFRDRLDMGLMDVAKAAYSMRELWLEAFFDPTNSFRIRMISNLSGSSSEFGNYRTWERFYVKSDQSRAVLVSLGADKSKLDRVVYRKKNGKAAVVEDYNSTGVLVRREVLEARKDTRTGDYYLTAFGQEISKGADGKYYEVKPDFKAAKRAQCLVCHTVSLRSVSGSSNRLVDNAHLSETTYSTINNYQKAPPTGHVIQRLSKTTEVSSPEIPKVKAIGSK